MKRILLTALIIFVSNFCSAQNTMFNGYMSFPDGARMGYGYVVFPLSRDTVAIDSTGAISVSLVNPKHRTFYVSNGDLKSRIFRFSSSYVSDSVHQVIIPDSSYYAYYQKRKICPICRLAKNVLPILYGFPSEKMLKQADSGKLLLGGCIVYDNQPQCYCKKDDFSF